MRRSSVRRSGLDSSLVLVAAVVAIGGCDEIDQRWGEVAQEAAQRKEVARAEAQYDSAAFDTVSWYSESARRLRGQGVYLHSCRKCHGPNGGGGGEMAREHDMDVPPIGGDDWLYHGNIPEIRRRVYVGHGPTMPSWGLAGLSARDVDAVAYYIEGHLRPAEQTGGDTTGAE